MRLTYLQFWTIVACLLLLILASVFFFLGKVSGSDKTTYTKNYTDSILITKYSNGGSIAAKPSQPGNKKAGNPVIDNADKKIGIPNKPANLTDLPQEKKKSPVQRDRRVEEFAEDQSPADNQDFDTSEKDDYSLSSDEIHTLLSGSNRDEQPRNVTGNITLPSNPVAGVKAFNDYVQRNRHPITDEDCANQHGKVILSFRVDNAGHPVDITIFRSLCQAADREAVRLLQTGPNWTASGDNFVRWEVAF